MSLKPFILQCLFVLLFCTSFLSAVDPQHSPFRLDAYGGLEAYVGSIDYGHNTQITRQVLVSEAQRVWNFLPKTGGPGMISALYTGNGKIYFASSIKGPAAQKDLGFPEIVTNALHTCKQELANQGTHVHDGRCSELMVISEWFTENGGGHSNSHVQLPSSGKMIVAVDHDLNVRRPCSEEDADPRHRVPYGCADVLPKLGFRPDEIVTEDPTCHVTRRSFGGLRIRRACVPKKPTTKPSPPAPKKPTVRTPPKKPTLGKPALGRGNPKALSKRGRL